MEKLDSKEYKVQMDDTSFVIRDYALFYVKNVNRAMERQFSVLDQSDNLKVDIYQKSQETVIMILSILGYISHGTMGTEDLTYCGYYSLDSNMIYKKSSRFHNLVSGKTIEENKLVMASQVINEWLTKIGYTRFASGQDSFAILRFRNKFFQEICDNNPHMMTLAFLEKEKLKAEEFQNNYGYIARYDPFWELYFERLAE